MLPSGATRHLSSRTGRTWRTSRAMSNPPTYLLKLGQESNFDAAELHEPAVDGIAQPALHDLAVAQLDGQHRPEPRHAATGWRPTTRHGSIPACLCPSSCPGRA